jgi:hypothetical protein
MKVLKMTIAILFVLFISTAVQVEAAERYSKIVNLVSQEKRSDVDQHGFFFLDEKLKEQYESKKLKKRVRNRVISRLNGLFLRSIPRIFSKDLSDKKTRIRIQRVFKQTIQKIGIYVQGGGEIKSIGGRSKLIFPDTLDKDVNIVNLDGINIINSFILIIGNIGFNNDDTNEIFKKLSNLNNEQAAIVNEIYLDLLSGIST